MRSDAPRLRRCGRFDRNRAAARTVRHRWRPARQATRDARHVARARPVGYLGRVGLVAQGICFGTIGALAVGLATGAGGSATGPQGALNALARHTWTKSLLVVLCVGFPCYAVWRFAQSLLDRGHMGHELGGIGRRAIQFVQGSAATALAVAAVRTLVDGGSRGGATQHRTAGIFGWPGGRELVLAVGATVAVAGVVTAYWGLSRRFEESLDLSGAGAATRRLLAGAGVAGLCALGVVLCAVGWFLLKAGVEFDPRAPVGIGAALAKLADVQYGRVLLGVTAAGLTVFGVFDVLQARYHKA